MQIACNEDTKEIKLHSKNLKISLHTLTVRNKNISPEISPNTSVSVKNINFDTKYDFLVIHLNDWLERDVQYEVNIDFEANLMLDGDFGYYRTSYVVNQKKDK